MKEIKKNSVVTKIQDITVVGDLLVNEFNGSIRTSAHLSQTRETYYPSRRMDTGFGDGLFENSLGEPFVQTRHTLINVPNGETVENVATMAAKFEESTIYRILSNNIEDVLSSKDAEAVAQGLTTKENLASKYVLRDSAGNVYARVTQDGEILDNTVVGTIVDGNIDLTVENALLEYKRDIYSREYKEDVDLRVKIEAKVAQAVPHMELEA